MQYLDLVNTLRRRCGIQGPALTAGTFAAAVGDNLNAVTWVADAWDEIQARSEFWHWMRKDFSFASTAARTYYLPTAAAPDANISDWAKWHVDTLRVYDPAVGRSTEQWLIDWDWEDWRNSYDFALGMPNDRPTVFAVRPRDHALALGPTPNKVWQITGEYQSAPVRLTGATDVPGMPSKFHMLVVYRAMLMYANLYAAPEVQLEGQRGINLWMPMLERDQLPEISLGDPLA